MENVYVKSLLFRIVSSWSKRSNCDNGFGILRCTRLFYMSSFLFKCLVYITFLAFGSTLEEPFYSVYCIYLTVSVFKRSLSSRLIGVY